MVWVSPVIPWENCDAARQIFLRYAWTYGDLTYKLDPDQLETYHEINKFFNSCTNSFDRIWINEWSRRLGKDFLTWVILRESSRKEKNEIYYYGTAFETDINDILIPIINEVEKDCPPELRIKPQQSKGHFIDLETNTMIRLIGLDKNPNGIRGKSAGRIVITEVSYVNKLDEAETAYKPMLVENPKASRIYNSTPGESTAHKWHTEIVPSAKLSKGYSKRILEDCKRFTEEQIEAAYKDFGGRNSTKSRREYRCEHVGEETRMIIPEWIDAKSECMVESYSQPECALCGDAIDPGQVDLHGNVYAYYDFANDMLVFERAYTMRSPKTSEIAEAIKRDETELWNGYLYYEAQTKSYKTNPYVRVSDTDLRLIKDLSEDYGLPFVAARKDDLRSAVNALRNRVQNRKIRLLPGAFELSLHLDAGIWDNNRHKFEHVSYVLGHFDLLAAAIYLHRHFETYINHINPLPPKILAPNVFCVKKPEEDKWKIKRDRYGRIIEKTKDKDELIRL